MKLYHGSICRIERPDISRSRSNLDFGRGFYLTSYIEQAENWARRKAAFSHAKGIVNEYDITDDLENASILRFDKADAAWVEFVCACRSGSDNYAAYDVIIGGVADDKVYLAVDMYYRGLWDMETTLDALKFYSVNDQWCFANQCVLDTHVEFVRSWEV